MSDPVPVSGKSCGTCTACCRMMAVPELYKNAWVDCPNCAIGKGCKIYPDRPQPCREFMCGWLLAPYMGEELKPERCHVVFFQPDADTIVANCDPRAPNAWRAPHVMEMLHVLARTFAQRIVLVRVENRYWRILEDTVVPITS
jgi:uncharacterized protein